MEIKRLKLSNIGRFTDLDIAFAPTETHSCKVTVLVGNNGSGKSTVLDALATLLSWQVAKIRSERGAGNKLNAGLISNGRSFGAMELTVSERFPFDGSGSLEQFSWTVAFAVSGRKSEAHNAFVKLGLLADGYRTLLTQNLGASLPLLVSYPVSRSYVEVSLKASANPGFDQMDGYQDAIGRGVSFRKFFEWFREREDRENEDGVSVDALNRHKEMYGADSNGAKLLSDLYEASRDRQLNSVRKAISAFMPGFDNLRVRRKPRLHMAVDKDGKTLDIDQLSQGELATMAMVGDIASRLALLNPNLENPLEGLGAILIDEIDLHLHPKWQRSVIARLTSTFPNCQFVLTTHSPLVISDVKEVLVYVLDNDGVHEQDSLYGLDANQVLLSVMNTDVRNSKVQADLDRIQSLLLSGQLEEAKSLYQTLSEELPETSIELAKADLLIRKLELRRAQN